jgi:acyl-CoA hydrolase
MQPSRRTAATQLAAGTFLLLRPGNVREGMNMPSYATVVRVRRTSVEVRLLSETEGPTADSV